MSSTAEAIATRIVSVFTGAGVAGGRVFRDRQAAFAIEESPAVVVEIDEERANHFGGSQRGAFGNVDTKEVTINITYATRSDNWQTALDTLRTQCHALLIDDELLNDTTQGLTATTANWDSANADLPFGTLSQRYTGKAIVNSNQL